MPRTPSNPPPDRPRATPSRPRWGLLAWLLIFVVLGYFLIKPMTAPEAAPISYTEFKKQAAAGNISDITIRGQEIRGRFKTPYETAPAYGEAPTKVMMFQTVKPAIEDPDLISILEKGNVTIRGEKTGTSWLATLAILLVPWLLIIGYFSYVRRSVQGQAQNFGGNLFGVGRSMAKRYTKMSSRVTYDDVAGLDNAKTELQEIVDYLKDPSRFKKLGADIPKGILLVGPPGTGKTLLARATAGEADVPFFSISGSEFIEMFVGVGASRVRDMFATAKREAPSIIFIDELDSVGRVRGTGLGGGHDEREQTLNQILSEMDGFAPHEAVIVLAATNRPDVLDPALTRPGRFDREVTLTLPGKVARRKILQIHTRRVPLAPDIDLDNLAARTVGFSGADIKNLVNEAALLAARQGKTRVDAEDFSNARDKVILGYKREEIIGDDEKRIFAYHEAGHTLVAKLIPGTDPLEKVTIIPRGLAMGATEQSPEEDRHHYKREDLLSRIAVLLGGRVAEKLVFHDVSSGAMDDLKKASQLARRMVSQMGMSERLGPVTFNVGEEHPFLGRELASPKDFSEETARIIDEEMQRIVSDQEKRALDLIGEHMDGLNRLAEELIKHETLERADIDRILGDVRPQPAPPGSPSPKPGSAPMPNPVPAATFSSDRTGEKKTE